MTRALRFQPIIARNQIEGANQEHPHRSDQWQENGNSNAGRETKFFSLETFSRWQLF